MDGIELFIHHRKYQYIFKKALPIVGSLDDTLD